MPILEGIGTRAWAMRSRIKFPTGSICGYTAKLRRETAITPEYRLSEGNYLVAHINHSKKLQTKAAVMDYRAIAMISNESRNVFIRSTALCLRQCKPHIQIGYPRREPELVRVSIITR